MEEEKNLDISVLCLTETWISERKQDLLKMDDFNYATSFCRKKHEGGGVCIMLKKGVDFKERKDITEISTEYIFETCALEICNMNLLIIVIYWPEKNRETDLFFGSLEQLLHVLSSKYSRKNIII